MKKQIQLELRSAEGGSDSKLLVEDMAAVYQRAAKINNFQCEVKCWREGHVVLWMSGKGVSKFFKNEAGGHRFHRTPPTERKGRTHTSLITVAVMEVDNYVPVEIRDSEVRVIYTRGTGAGGQHKNKTSSCVVMTHIGTGLQARVDGRDQHKNERDAKKVLTERVNYLYRTGQTLEIDQIRKAQVGTGNRADKRRTYRMKDGTVTDHVTGKTAQVKKVMRGNLGLLHK